MSIHFNNLESGVKAYRDLLLTLASDLKSPEERLKHGFKQEDLRELYTKICLSEAEVKKLTANVKAELKNSSMENPQIFFKWFKLLKQIKAVKKVAKNLEKKQTQVAKNLGTNPFQKMGMCAKVWHWITAPIRAPQRAYYGIKYGIADLKASAIANTKATIHALLWQNIKLKANSCGTRLAASAKSGLKVLRAQAINAGTASLVFGQLIGSDQCRFVGATLVVGAVAIPTIASLATRTLCYRKTAPVQTQTAKP